MNHPTAKKAKRAKSKRPAKVRVVKGTLPPSSNPGHSFNYQWRKFMRENEESFRPSTLGITDPRLYLYNRLWNAFLCGFNAKPTPKARPRNGE